MDLPLPFQIALILLWGAAWGSFLNVVIYRVPAGISVVWPPSRCPRCQTTLAWWQNVPVLGWAFVGGRCVTCRAAVSARYPAVEALCAALALAVGLPWIQAYAAGELLGWQALAGIAFEHAFVFAMLAIAIIDAETFLIPDGLSLPLPILGIAGALALGELRAVTWQQAAIGASIGAFGTLAVQWGYRAVLGREGLGTGDVKLLAGIGAWLGPAALPAVLLLASVQGLLFVGVSAVAGTRWSAERGLASIRHLALPFGPFLAVAALQWQLGGRHVAAWWPILGGG